MINDTDPDADVALCRCCGEARASCGDPHLDLVCADCYLELTLARGVMNDIGLAIGIEGCADPRRKRRPA